MSSAAGTAILCPRDGAELVEVDRDGVLVDACPSCRGIWLDRGELDKLIEHERGTRSADEDFLAEVTGRHDTDRHEDDRDEKDGPPQGGRRKRDRGGFLENFLDFGG